MSPFKVGDVVTDSYGDRMLVRWVDEEGLWASGEIEGGFSSDAACFFAPDWIRNSACGEWRLIPPRPPVVVSDAVWRAYSEASGFARHLPGSLHYEAGMRGLAAAIAAYLDEQEAKP